jgi:hypothetical protein
MGVISMRNGKSGLTTCPNTVDSPAQSSSWRIRQKGSRVVLVLAVRNGDVFVACVAKSRDR